MMDSRRALKSSSITAGPKSLGLTPGTKPRGFSPGGRLLPRIKPIPHQPHCHLQRVTPCGCPTSTPLPPRPPATVRRPPVEDLHITAGQERPARVTIRGSGPHPQSQPSPLRLLLHLSLEPL